MRAKPAAFAGVKHVLFGGEAVDPRWVRACLEAGAPGRVIVGLTGLIGLTLGGWVADRIHQRFARGRLMFAADLVGTAEQVAEQLYAHAGFREVEEVVFALPFSFEPEDYVQILTDIAGTLGPALGWTPAA